MNKDIKQQEQQGNGVLPCVRQRALQWWKELGDNIGEIADKYNRGCETIQEYQIEEIYNKEHSLFKKECRNKNCVYNVSSICKCTGIGIVCQSHVA